MLRGLIVLLLLLQAKNVGAQTVCTASEIRTEVTINASVDKIWQVLINTSDYASWHPYITSVTGSLTVGQKIKVYYKEGATTKHFKAKVLTLEPNHQLAWGGSLGFLFRAKHYFMLSSVGRNQTLLVQGEYWRGWFGKSYGKKLFQSTFSKFVAMNDSLKLQVEPHIH